MDEDEQKRRFWNNLMVPNIKAFIHELLSKFYVLYFTLRPGTRKWELTSSVTPSHISVFSTNNDIEIGSITFLFTKLLLPNVVYHWENGSIIQLPHLHIEIYAVRQLPKAFTDVDFYWKYEKYLGVDLEK